ncbi:MULTISPECIES: uroporphyrinogen-III synthase [Bradyrhizobium]|uniref:Uroporphyrinogen-III synthase n=1 Tax=Bradyrhizobium ottawaense TaxID=931866 RepID=A0ABV4FPW8_9BRAD|nr:MULTISPECIES: uroporphyrinogen-III synthase [Bradyrhizobium]MBR1288508.1 uroporphyrinogen-III synthase [Bradyrhizobium ottawaense]MDA9417313.1 uroporphyrinogen III synthase [Bradyrhizobium sp. CCBAU 25360]MDA9484296.1 uroporphyrinogen III synthase [Bradyrhizobium sp. CCBAU 11445]PDT70953.1 uroporphyrinogen III synthase [Bradyrhizobium ottawaense]WLB46247.1 uroporphyrinogen-III synthase [Bradyrhizobium ottawaense]
MSILVTRPHPDNETTAEKLRARGLAVLLAPVLKFEPVAFHDESEAPYGAILVTSANAIRAVAPQLQDLGLLELPLFAVGEHTAAAARDAGFAEVIVAGGDAASLRDKVMQSARDKVLKKKSTLLYLAGADLSRDLGGELGAEGFSVVTQTTYRMAPVKHLPREVCEGFAAHGVEAVLHYSRRSARAFLDAARDEGVEISALAIPQCCLSETVASVLRDAGASQVLVAATPDENALFTTLERALRTRLA